MDATSKVLFLTIGIAAQITRFYQIDLPPWICWDETHFGKMGTYYLNHTFFMDVHPPLGKMLIGFAGHLTGYEANFDFDKAGIPYGDVHYEGMRMFCAGLGTALIPLVFLIVWECTGSLPASALAAISVLLDVGTLTLSRFILLDTPLLFFILLSVYMYCKLCTAQQNHRQFTFRWWVWLALTGASLAAAISVKFVGLFVVLLIGLSTVVQLWAILTNITNSLLRVIGHLMSRVLCLIILPCLIYLSFFAVHMRYLNYSGPGDGSCSSDFQASLIGNPLHNTSMPAEIAYGSVVTLKSTEIPYSYIHSHEQLYPEGGPRQQQVTGYDFRDSNNMWQVQPPDRTIHANDTPVYILRDGDGLRLMHVNTKRLLHSHMHPAFVSKRDMQVTGYGNNGEGDENDVWRIQIVSSESQFVHVLTTRFRLIHALLGCALTTHADIRLPPWAFEQYEVSCSMNHAVGTVWTIETVQDERIESVPLNLPPPSFLQKLLELHIVMFKSNNGLTPREDEEHSRPWMWPVNYKGQPFSGGNHRIYLLGSPLCFWFTLAAMVIFPFCFIFSVIFEKRQWIAKTASLAALRTSGIWFYCAWLLHYIPFWLMGRILYFHHYFPAFLFAAMVFGISVEMLGRGLECTLGSRVGRYAYLFLHGLVIVLLVNNFLWFMPLTYGMDGPPGHLPGTQWAHLRWLPTWDI